MSEISLDNKKMPIPKRGTRRIYPFDKLGVGDSFLVRGVSRKRLRSITTSGKYYSRTYTEGKAKFEVRYVEEGIRVWRVKDNQ